MNKSLIIIFVTAILAYSALSQKNVFQTKTLYPNVHEIENALPESCVSLLGPQPIPGTAKFLNKKVFGYHPYWMGETYFAYRFDLLSTIAWFSVVPGKDGSFIRMRGWPPMPLISLAHANGVKVVPVIANFNPESLIAILSSASSSDCLIKNIISTISDSNADGVNIDFERLPFSQRDNFVNFISNLTVRLHNELPGKEITVAVPAVDFHTAYDVEKLARITDGLFIMGYAYHYRGSRYTGAVAPFDSGKRNLKSTVLNYIDITKNQRDKLILGLPYYALEWQVNTNLPETKTLSPAVALWFTPAARQAEIYGKNWDEISKTPWYSRTELTNTYQTWFDDAKSLKIKFGLVDEFNLSGGGVWALGYDYGQTDLWNVLENKFGSRGNPSLRFTYDFSPTPEKLRFHINKNDLIENLNVKKKINKNSVEYVFPDPVDITNICVFGGAYDARQFLNFDVSVIQNKQTNFTHLITAYSGSPDVTLVCPTDNLYSAVSVFRDYGPIAKKVTALKLTFHKVGNTNSKTFVNADDATLDSIIRKINISGFAEEENSNAAISPFAINAVKPFHLYHNLDTTGELRFALLKETGAKWDRTDFWWGRIEPEKGKFDFSFPDHVVKTFEKHNISLLPILNYTAAWATNGYAPTSPKELSDFSNYVYKVVKRYPQFSHWEVWNEPNLIHFWKPEPNVNDYTKLLKITAIAARKANPNVKLVGGSLAYSDADYLKKMYQNGAKGSFDVFSYHYYKVTPPEKEVIDELNKIIIVMNRFGDTSTPIWITEMGTSNHPDRGVDEAHQAAYLTRNYFIALSFPRVERIFQFDLMNWTDKRVADGWGRQLGLVRADGTRKISFYAYSNMVARISPRKNSAWRPKRLFSPEWPEDVFVYYYEHNSKPSLIIYSDNTNAAPISIRILTNNYSVYSQTVQPQSKPHSRPANAGFPARHSPPLKAKTCVCGWVADRAGDVIQITPFYQPVYIEGVDPTYSQLTTNLSPFILLESEFDTRDGIFGLNTSLAMADAGYSDYTLSIESSDKKFNSILTNSSALYSDNFYPIKISDIISPVNISSVWTRGKLRVSSPQKKIAVHKFSSRTPKIDGELDDWKNIPELSLKKLSQVTVGKEFFSENDGVGSVKCQWTTNGFYFIAEIIDSEWPVNPFKPEEAWKGDCIEFYFGLTNPYSRSQFCPRDTKIIIGFFKGMNNNNLKTWDSKTGAEIKNIQIAVLGPNPATICGAPISRLERCRRIGIRQDFCNAESGTLQIVADQSKNVHYIEGFIPTENLPGKAPKPGDVISFDVSLKDYDSNGKYISLMWCGNGENWVNPTPWGAAIIK